MALLATPFPFYLSSSHGGGLGYVYYHNRSSATTLITPTTTYNEAAPFALQYPQQCSTNYFTEPSEGAGGDETATPSLNSTSPSMDTPLTQSDDSYMSCYDLRNHGLHGFNNTVIYKQIVYRDIPYPNPNGSVCGPHSNLPCTVGTSGCGLVSMQMVLNRLTGQYVQMHDLVDFALTPGSGRRGPDGTTEKFFTDAAAHWGVHIRLLRGWDAQIAPELRLSNMVIIGGHGDSKPFTQKGHYVVLTAIHNDGTVEVNDPWGGIERDFKAYPQSIIHTEYTNGKAWVLYR